jgi:hypothetical protein
VRVVRADSKGLPLNCLAFTGSSNAIPILIIAGVLLAAGIALLVILRVRRGRFGAGTGVLILLPVLLGALALSNVPAPAQAVATANHCAASQTPGDPGTPGTSGNPGDPGGTGDPSAGPPTSTPTPTSTPSTPPTSTPTPTDTPTPTSTPTPPACVPTIYGDIQQQFPEWAISDNGILTAPDPTASIAAEMHILDTVSILYAQSTMTISNATSSQTETLPNDFNFNHPSEAMTLHQPDVDAFSISSGISTPLTLDVKVVYSYDDGCGTTRTVFLEDQGGYSPAPAIPE